MDNSTFVNRAADLANSPFLLFPPEDKKYGPYWKIRWMGTDRKQWKAGENEAVVAIHPAESYLSGTGAPWVDADVKELPQMIESRLNTPLKDATVNANYSLPVTSDDFPIEAGYYILNFTTDRGDVKALVAIQPPDPNYVQISPDQRLPDHPHLALMADKTAMGWDEVTFVTGGIHNLPALLMSARSNIGWAKVPHEDLINIPNAINYLLLNY